ncbi:MAG: hypothetical protein Tsb0014_02520 [Pleurocapsa sp.]
MANRQTVYRFVDSNNDNNYLYTASTAERNDLILNPGDFVFDEVSYFSAETDSGQSVYRFLNNETNTYFYTINEDERDSFEADSKYEFQGEAFRAFASTQQGATEIYSVYNPATDIYVFTPDETERDALVNSSGFQSQGVAFYGFPVTSNSDTPPTEDSISDTSPPPTGTGVISGLVWNDFNRSQGRDTAFIQGDDPDVVFVIDVSGSTTLGQFQGTTSVGDVNGDGGENDILDAELAAFIALNQLLIDQGLGDDVNIAIVPFADFGVQVDMNRVADEPQLTVTPNADANNNDTPDVEEILSFIDNPNIDNNPASGTGGGTNFRNALQTAQDTFDEIGTESGNGNLIFLSDGEASISSDDDVLVNLRDNNNVNISAFGVGSGSDIDALREIDPNAEQFTSTDGLLDTFENRGTIESGLEGIEVYLDTNDNGTLDDNETVVETDASGRYEFTGLVADDYIVRPVIPQGFAQDFINQEQYTVQLADDETVTDRNFGIDAIDRDDFTGGEIEVQVYTPDRATESGDPVVATVEDGFEFGDLPSDDINSDSEVDVNIDFSATSIEFIIGSNSVAGSFGNDDFNGYVFRDNLNAIAQIQGVTIDPSGTTLDLEAEDISFTANSIDVNVAGLAYTPGDTIKLDVEF